MAAKKISAVITAPNSEPYRVYFQQAGDTIAAWTKDASAVLIRTDRYNGGVFSRDWVRACFLPDVTVEF